MYVKDMSKIVNKINELYILYRKKYIITNSEIMKTKGYIIAKEYDFKLKKSNDKNKVLIDNEVKKHLLHQQTIGVFAGTVFSKFLCFDVDIKDPAEAKMAVYILVNALQEMGIPDENIIISTSGNKGYHVELFFDKPVLNTMIEQFQLFVLNYTGLLNDINGDIERRPTEGRAVKIPLGKHFGTNKICWYCDYEKNLQPIENFEYILSIKQLDTEYFCEMVNYHNESIDTTFKKAEQYENAVSKYKSLDIYNVNVDENITIEDTEELINNGLAINSSRHNSLLKIAKYNKHFGMNIEDNKNFLIEWLSQQDKQMYSTKWDDCIKDIELVVKWTYDNNRSFVMKNSNIHITKEEILSILNLEGKNDKVVLYSLIIHRKRYGLKNGLFYMSYKQMQESTGLCENTVIKIIKYLESINIIKVIRGDKLIYNKKKGRLTSEVNRYEINTHLTSKLYKFKSKTENTHTFKVCDKKCSNCFASCMFKLLDKKEVKKILPRRQYESFSSSIDMLQCVNYT